ncbi:hypothetical protein [Synechococcus phage BUCT-ZZ01]|nr:hypothetical protein [Synechococcus phage BUCT-ZZ01]
MFTFEEALKAIEHKKEFTVIEKNFYSVIDYNVTTSDTFKGSDAREDMILCNLRGTAFDESGRIISLPLHKFHNLNECDGYLDHQIDFSKRESVMLKMDGSMIRIIPDGMNSFVFGTRAGETDVSKMVDDWFQNLVNEHKDGHYQSLIFFCIRNGLTPIFEFCSRKNKVVVDYPEPKLVLLAVRRNMDGIYLPHDWMVAEWGNKIPVVESFDTFDADTIRKWKDAEGVVVSFPDGFRVKLKAEEYVRKHRAKDLIRFEKDVVRMILEDTVDDVIPLVSDWKPTEPKIYGDNFSEQDNLRHYRDYLHRAILAKTTLLTKWLQREVIDKNLTRADAAKLIIAKMPNEKSFLFNMIDGKDVSECIKYHLISCCSSGPKIEEALIKLGIDRWYNVTHSEKEG